MLALVRAVALGAVLAALTPSGGRAEPPERTPRAAHAPAAASPPPSDEPAAEDEAGVVRLRFGWPDAAAVRTTQRRTLLRTGQPPVSTTTYFTQRLERREGALRLTTSGTTWEGASPYPGPPEAVDAVLRSAEEVVQVVSAEGEFRGLEGLEALRPALARVLEGSVAPDQLERALAFAEGALQARAQEMWNLAVGFWIGADLRLGERYGMRAAAEVPLAGGRLELQQEFAVRRRVPCSARDRDERCVEVTLRSTPDPAALAGVADAVLAQLAGPDEPPPAGALRELVLEDELILVTEPATLLPHRFAWTRSARATLEGGGAAAVLERVDRSETDYRYDPPPARPRRPGRAKGAASAAAR